MTSQRSSLSLARALALLTGLALMVAVLLPGGRAADEPDPEPPTKWPKTTAADRARSINNLRQISLAFHNFCAVYGAMPAAAICDKNGKALLSWRVAILPYVEHENLYKQFKLNEPWDSKHNKKLLAKMPQVYAPPIQGKPRKAYTTYYQVFTGANTPFNPKKVGGTPPISLGIALGNIPDGTSNTFLVAEAGEAVPWTRPVDLVTTANKPIPRLGGLFEEGFNVAMCDGSTRFLGRKINPVVLRHLIDPADGNAIDWTKIPAPQMRKRK